MSKMLMKVLLTSFGPTALTLIVLFGNMGVFSTYTPPPPVMPAEDAYNDFIKDLTEPIRRASE